MPSSLETFFQLIMMPSGQIGILYSVFFCDLNSNVADSNVAGLKIGLAVSSINPQKFLTGDPLATTA